MAGTRRNATDVRDSIEARVDRDKDHDVEMADAPADENEEDAAGEPDVEIEDDGEDDDADDDDPANFAKRIDKMQRFLSEYQENGEEIAAGFQRIPNKRVLPDYFTVISTPIAFSTVRHKLNKKLYTGFTEFVRDVAQICHNAQVYNRPSAGIFKAAERLREVFKEQLKGLVEKGVIKPEEAVLPVLGELPPADESPEPGEGDEDDAEEEDEEEEEEEEEDEEDADSDDGGRRRSRRARKSGRRASEADDDEHRRKGRPPKLLTPTEGRIDALLKGLRKYKNEDDELLVSPFDKLPDKQEFPDYYETITNPISIDMIKTKSKRKQYASVDQALADLELMFNNAKTYNEDDSPIFEAAEELQKKARILAAEQKAMPDDEFRVENGRLPLDQIQQRGETYRVGDWVHIKNGNPDNKPIVGQIFRMWQENNGQKFVNACWYYRPDQTVHHFQKHFFPQEVFKSGQYRDHPAEDVLDKCFVMYITRFFKGRPRGFPSDKSAYVCDTRYNETESRFRKIKTWSSCVPEESRGKDYQMDLFPTPMPQTRMDSPIKHLLRPDAKPTDPLPKATWGHVNSPPIVGAVHCRPRDPQELTPPPSQPPQPIAHANPYSDPSRHHTFVPQRHSQPSMTMSQSPVTPFNSMQGPGHGPSASPGQYQAQPYQQAQPVYQTTSPVAHHQMPMQQHHSPVAPRTIQHDSFRQVYPQQQQRPPAQPYQQLQPQPQQGYHHQPAQAPYQQYPQSTPGAGTPHAHHQQMHTGANSVAPTYDHHRKSSMTPAQPRQNYMAPAPAGPVDMKVYHLPDEIEAAIPKEIRARFPQDDKGKMLWFTSPPEDVPAQNLAPESHGIGHSMSYKRNVELLADVKGNGDIEELANKKLKEYKSMTGPKKNGFKERALQRLEARARRDAEAKRRAEEEAAKKTPEEEEEETDYIIDCAVKGLIQFTVAYEEQTQAMMEERGLPYTHPADALGVKRWTRKTNMDRQGRFYKEDGEPDAEFRERVDRAVGKLARDAADA